MTRPAGEGSWEGLGWQERAVGAIRLAGEQLGIDQAGRGVVRGCAGWQAEAVRGNEAGRQASSWEPAILNCEMDVQLPI